MRETARPRPHRRSALGAPDTERSGGQGPEEARGPHCARPVVLGAGFVFYAESSGGPQVIFFFTFYFEKMTDSQEVAKIVQRSPVHPSPSVPQRRQRQLYR